MVPFTPMTLGRKPRPFEDSEWLFELKYDGFRALAVVELGRCTLYSRNGHPFASFAELATRIANAVRPKEVRELLLAPANFNRSATICKRLPTTALAAAVQIESNAAATCCPEPQCA